MNTFLRLTNKTRTQFTKFNNEIFSKLDYEPNKLYIKGSFIIPVLSLFSSDIDLYEPINIKDFDKFYNKLRKTIIDLAQNIEYIDIYGSFKGSPSQFLNIPKDKLFNLLSQSEGRIQIELSFFYNGVIEGISIMYDLKKNENMKVDKVIDSLYDVIDEKIKKNVFKGLKRLYSMLILLPENKERKLKLKLLTSLLTNSLYGSLYLAVNHLSSIEDTKLFKIDIKKQALQNIKSLVRKTGLLTPNLNSKFNSFSLKNVNSIKQNLRRKLNKLIQEDPEFKKLRILK